MRFSYYLNPQTPGPEDDRRMLYEVLGQVDLAEQLGFADVWLTEHHFTGYNTYSDALTLAAAISQRNPSLNIGFAVNVVPLMHPIRFVTQCNLLDQLTDGKIIVGIGPGNSPDEFAGYGVDVESRHEIMMEFLEICDLAWDTPRAAGGFEHHGKYWDLEVRGRIIPEPVQQPRPVIAYASATPERLAMAGRRGWSLLLGPQKPEILAARLHHFFEGMDEAGLTDEQRALAWKHTSVLRQIYVAAPGENWLETMDDVIDTYVRKSARANSGVDDLDKTDYDRRRKQYMEGGWLHAGTADEVFELLRPFAELGISNLMCWMAFGHNSDERVRASLERFAKDVAPRLQEVEPDRHLLPQLVEASEMKTHPAIYT
jgi:alkanesulfonate monooxygenase SsuD/methylene tetrahydromethanopterin reductase-like flavin-dependent oxidoreductase (luciferase family)